MLATSKVCNKSIFRTMNVYLSFLENKSMGILLMFICLKAAGQHSKPPASWKKEGEESGKITERKRSAMCTYNLDSANWQRTWHTAPVAVTTTTAEESTTLQTGEWDSGGHVSAMISHLNYLPCTKCGCALIRHCFGISNIRNSQHIYILGIHCQG